MTTTKPSEDKPREFFNWRIGNKWFSWVVREGAFIVRLVDESTYTIERSAYDEAMARVSALEAENRNLKSIIARELSENDENKAGIRRL